MITQRTCDGARGGFSKCDKEIGIVLARTSPTFTYLVSSSDSSGRSLRHLSSHPVLCLKILRSARRIFLYAVFLSSVWEGEKQSQLIRRGFMRQKTNRNLL